jgi:CheY-like chemotaxis protein
MSTSIKILWADDEIDLLKPQLFFLEKKGYEVVTVTNGHDALDALEESRDIDVVFLDESMPGLTGLETLTKIKKNNGSLPVVMITKNEAENLMEEAIGSQIDDYLIKPVNPNQILLTLKKLIDNKRLVSEKTATDYQQEFRQIGMDINDNPDYQGWVDIYKNIIDWELKLDASDNPEMKEILEMQKSEANKEFCKYIIRYYEEWHMRKEGPILSHQMLREKVLTDLDTTKPTVFFLLDNLRYDQYKIIEPMITELFRVEKEDYFYSILPTSTQYSRNAIFSGMMPRDIQKTYPDKWVNDNEEGGKNNFEADFLKDQITRTFKDDLKVDYLKITNVNSARNMADAIINYLNNDFTAIVYNFIDMLSHARTEMEVLKELAGDEKAYRSLTLSWFKNSPLWIALNKLAERDVQIYISTDHGTIRVKQPSKVVGDRETSANLRYKVGKNLKYDDRDVLAFKDPHSVGLPKPNMSSTFIFAKEDYFFLYPNNYNYHNKMYRDTFQHGGISLEEVICPVIKLSPK